MSKLNITLTTWPSTNHYWLFTLKVSIFQYALFGHLILFLYDKKDVNLEIHLHFVPSDECFKYHRFNPSMNNVRKEWFARNFLGEQVENENKMETGFD